MEKKFEDGDPKSIAFDLLDSGNNMLDIGCGDGEFGRIIKTRGLYKHVYGIELDEDHLKICKTKGLEVRRVNLNKESLPFESNFFSAVTALDVLEHINNPSSLINEIKRVLTPKGIFILSTPNIQCIYHIFRLILGHGPKTSFDHDETYYGSNLYDSGHVNYFTINDMIEILNQAGFEIELCVGTYNTTHLNISKLIKAFNKSILNFYLSPGFLIKTISKK